MRSQTGDHGKLLNIGAIVLTALEDKTDPGALIASLSTPFGEQVSAEVRDVGYRAVWPRDFLLMRHGAARPRRPGKA
jgi:glucoamylase